MPSPPWAERLTPLAAIARLGVITDIDGTISPIAPTPEEAIVEPNCAAALRRLVRLVPRIAVVSGRGALDARRMVGIAEAIYVGNHGLERCVDSEVVVAHDALRFVAAVERAVIAIRKAPLPPGVLIENKGVTASIHYRLAPPGADIGALDLVLRDVAVAEGLELRAGRMVFELRPRVAIDKGAAVTEIVRDDRLAGAIYLGDDLTDVDAFSALGRLRDQGGIATAAVAVIGGETSSAVYESADVTVAGIDGAAELLAWLADERERLGLAA